MTTAVIVSTARTPLAKSWKGAFNMTHGATLGGHAVRHAVERAGIDGVEVDAMLAALSGLDAPVLVVGGGRDALTGTVSVDLVARSFPGARTVVLPRAGHFPWVDEPDAFRTTVTDFLRQVRGPTGPA